MQDNEIDDRTAPRRACAETRPRIVIHLFSRRQASDGLTVAYAFPCGEDQRDKYQGLAAGLPNSANKVDGGGVYTSMRRSIISVRVKMVLRTGSLHMTEVRKKYKQRPLRMSEPSLSRKVSRKWVYCVERTDVH